MSLVIGSWSNEKENLGTGWEMLAKVQVSFLQSWLQCKMGKKKSQKWDLWVFYCCRRWHIRSTAQGLAGAELVQYLSKVLVGHKHLLQWSLAEPTRILCMSRSPLPLRFAQMELLFSHRHKGQVKPDSAMSPPGLCSISKPPEQGCCCVSPRLPVITGRVCFVVCFHSYFQCTFEGKEKKAAFYFPRMAPAGKTLSGPSWQDAQRQGTKWGRGSFPLRCLIRCWIFDLGTLSQGLVWWVPVSGDTVNPAIHTAHGTSGTARDFCAYCKQITPFFGVYNLQMSNLPLSHWFTMPADSPSQEILIQTLESICKNKCHSTCIQAFLLSWPQSRLKKKSASLSPFDNWENRGERKARRGFLTSMCHTEPAPAGEQQC